jgi:hypothetical protein
MASPVGLVPLAHVHADVVLQGVLGTPPHGHLDTSSTAAGCRSNKRLLSDLALHTGTINGSSQYERWVWSVVSWRLAGNREPPGDWQQPDGFTGCAQLGV